MVFSIIPLNIFAENTTGADVTNGDVTVGATNTFGKLLAENFDTNVIDKTASYYVSDVTVSGNTADIELGNEEACTLVVAAYDENTNQMLASAVEAVEAETESAAVTFDSSLPAHFIVKAFLLDDNNAALCSAYFNYHYTSKFEKFYEKTVDDFDSSRVVNLDEDKTKNFFVLDNGVINIKSTDTVNTVVKNDDDNNTYVIGNIDDTVRSLKKGDTFFLKNGDELILVKIDSVEFDGTTATFTSTAVDSENVFDYVKIESSATTSDFGMDESTLGEGMNYVDDYAPEESFHLDSADFFETNDAKTYTLSDSFTFLVGKKSDGKPDESGLYAKMSGSLKLTISGKASFYQDNESDFKEASLSIEISLAVTLEVKATLSYQQPICEFAWTVVPGCYVGVNPTFVISGTFKGTLKGTVTAGWGATYNSDRDDAWQDGVKKPNFKPELKYEIDIFVGVDLKPFLKVISKHLLVFELNSTAGFHIKAKYTPLASTGESTIHQCKSCIDGKISFDFSLGFAVTLGKDTAFESKISSGNLFDLPSIHLADFYYSEDFDEFAFTKCPHCYYKVVIGVRSEKDGSVIDDSTVSPNGGYTYDKDKKEFSEITGIVKTNENGDCTVYFTAGKYEIFADAPLYESGSAKINVDSPISMEMIKLKETKLYPVTFHVTDALTGEDLSGFDVKAVNGLAENDIKSNKTTAATDYAGNVTLYFPYNSTVKTVTFSESFSDVDYTSVTKTISNTVILDNHYEIKMYQCKKSNIKFIITDSETNESISASVILSGTEDNPYKSLGITELSTSAPYGTASLDVPNGGYTLTITATGYESYSGSFTANKDGTVYFSLTKEKEDEDEEDTDLSDNKVGDIITFGSYPQSKVTDSTTLSALNSMSKSWVSYGYYSGSGSWDDGQMKPSDYMKYCDISYNGNKYRAVTFSSYRPYYTGYKNTDGTYQDDNGYYTGNVYYFKYEPLKWRVLDPSEGFVMCNTAIDAQAYNNYVLYYDNGNRTSADDYYGNSAKTYYASDWANSSIRVWLNNDFYNTAFTSSEKSQIGTTYNENKSTWSSEYDSANTSDKIFLLSYNEVTNSKYGFSSSAYDTARRLKSTDYAKCQGCCSETSTSYYGNSWWRLRSPYDSYSAASVWHDGHASTYSSGTYTNYGVVPAFKFNPKSTISTSSIEESEITLDSIENTVASTAASVQNATCSSCVAGNDYILLNILDYSDNFKLSSDNLLYIDQLTADENGKVSTSFIPKLNDENSTTLLIGDFGNGTEAKIIRRNNVNIYTAKLMVDGKLYKEIEYNEGQKSISLPAVPKKDGYVGKWESYSLTNGGTVINAVYTAVSVSIGNVEVKYKETASIKPEIKTDGDVKYTVKYETSDPKIVTVDKNGNITTHHKGTANVTCIVLDEVGEVLTKDTKTITVKFSFGQWLIWIFLLGFLWY